ncbi:MAG: hypothetical protein ACRDOL_31870 [Streptosporangiaceae bacterium]
MTGVLVQLPYPTRRRGLTSVTLRPGVVDDNAREVFGWGYCHVLAGALHETTGWPLGVLRMLFGPPGRRAWHWIHAGVHPGTAGLFLDIHGIRRPPEVEADFAPYGGPFQWLLPGEHRRFCPVVGLPDGIPATWWRQDLAAAAAARGRGHRQVPGRPGTDPGDPVIIQAARQRRDTRQVVQPQTSTYGQPVVAGAPWPQRPGRTARPSPRP